MNKNNINQVSDISDCFEGEVVGIGGMPTISNDYFAKGVEKYHMQKDQKGGIRDFAEFMFKYEMNFYKIHVVPQVQESYAVVGGVK